MGVPCGELIERAYYHILQNDFVSAIAAFKKALSICPNDAELYYRLSITYTRSHLLQEALRAARTAVELNPESADYKAQLRHIKAIQTHLEAIEFAKHSETLSYAEMLLKQAIEMDPVYIQAYVDLGNVYREQGDFEKAMSSYQLALDLVPEHLEAKIRLSEIKPYLES